MNTNLKKRLFYGISMLLTILTVILCFHYTYGTTRYLQFHTKDGTELYMSDMIKQLNKSKDNVSIDLNQQWRNQGVTVTGHFKISEIKNSEFPDYYKVVSLDGYTQSSQGNITGMFEVIGDIPRQKTICLYVPKDKIDAKNYLKYNEIYFSGRFDNITGKYLVITKGEIK